MPGRGRPGQGTGTLTNEPQLEEFGPLILFHGLPPRSSAFCWDTDLYGFARMIREDPREPVFFIVFVTA